jgi:hypothetical protein
MYTKFLSANLKRKYSSVGPSVDDFRNDFLERGLE